MQNIIKNLQKARQRQNRATRLTEDDVIVIIYALESVKTGEISYVGASTNPETRWRRSATDPKPERIVNLETTTLGNQVIRETFWIEEMLGRGHALRNVSAPQKIQVRGRRW